MEKKVNQFMSELKELCEKHNLYLTSCGCCDSIHICNDISCYTNTVVASEFDTDNGKFTYMIRR